MPAVTHRNPARTYDDRQAVVAAEYEDTFDQGPSFISVIARVLALATGAALTILGLVAIARIDWDAGMDAPSVRVADMPFTPEVAIGAVALGVLAIVCAAVWVSDLPLAMGAILAAIGVAILLASNDSNELELVDRHGWIVLGVGVVLFLTGLLSANGYFARRRVAEHRYVRDGDTIDLR